MPRAVQWLEDAQRGIFADLQWAYETGIEPGNADLVSVVANLELAAFETVVTDLERRRCYEKV